MNDFSRIQKTASGIAAGGCLTMIIHIAIVISIVVGVIFLATHPALIGTFFGTVVHSFNAAK